MSLLCDEYQVKQIVYRFKRAASTYHLIFGLVEVKWSHVASGLQFSPHTDSTHHFALHHFAKKCDWQNNGGQNEGITNNALSPFLLNLEPRLSSFQQRHHRFDAEFELLTGIRIRLKAELVHSFGNLAVSFFDQPLNQLLVSNAFKGFQ